MGYISQLKEDLEQKVTTWQREVDLKLMKSVWGAHVRTQRRMNCVRNGYANPLECVYVVTDHLRLWNETFSTPIKD